MSNTWVARWTDQVLVFRLISSTTALCLAHNASSITIVSSGREYQRFSCGAVDPSAYLAATYERARFGSYVRIERAAMYGKRYNCIPYTTIQRKYP
ncbi:hypothetical protein C8Q73DRAFT_143666 [Cubamyces lactineus]|nr:hypothetical protein C8Q73DRAFT_143666 [Cubamyces lactineus]